MALTRVTEKKIAANRRNAQRSTGPRTPGGKARSSQNGCVHHARASQHPLPESWDDEFRRRAHSVVAETANPMRRALEFDVAYHILWSFRLLDQEARVINVCLNRFPPDSKNGAHLFLFDPGVRAFHRHMLRVERRIGRALRALCAYLKPPIPRSPRAAAASAQFSRQLPGLQNFLAILKQIRQLKPDPKQNKGTSSALIRVNPRSMSSSLLLGFELVQVVQQKLGTGEHRLEHTRAGLVDIHLVAVDEQHRQPPRRLEASQRRRCLPRVRAPVRQVEQNKIGRVVQNPAGSASAIFKFNRHVIAGGPQLGGPGIGGGLIPLAVIGGNWPVVGEAIVGSLS